MTAAGDLTGRMGKGIAMVKSVVSVVHEQLRNEILTGSLRPGEQIVVTAVAGRLAASTVPIREALRRLEGEGLVEFEANIGARVKSITMDDLRDIYLTRQVTERATVAAAVEAGAVPVRRLQTQFERMEQAYRTHDAKAYELHRAFHVLLVSTGTRVRLERIVNALLDESDRYFRLVPGLPTEASTLIALHRDILLAVQAGDADAAGRAVHDHTEYSLQRLPHRSIDSGRATV